MSVTATHGRIESVIDESASSVTPTKGSGVFKRSAHARRAVQLKGAFLEERPQKPYRRT
jgi:hypothetical protein